MNTTVRISPAIPEREPWSAFVLNHADGNIFHSPIMFDLFSLSGTYEPVVVSSYNQAGILTGLLVSVIHREHSGIPGRFSARSIVWGGPLIQDNDPQTASLILDEYDRFIRRKAIYSQFRNLNDCSGFIDLFARKGYRYENHLNILVDLTKSEQQLQSELHPKRRNEIRKAEKEGVTVREITNPDDHRECYRIIQQVYRRVKLPVPGLRFFDEAAGILGTGGFFKKFGAFYQDKLIGVMMVLCYKDCMYDWYAGSLTEYYSKNPNDLIPWKVFLWGKANGYTRFDFGGAGRAEKPYGVRDYKQKFGGTTVNFGRFEAIHQPLKMWIAKMGFKVWRLIR